MIKSIRLGIVTAAIALSSGAYAACSGGVIDNVSQTTQAVRLGGKIFFQTTGLELDFDGSPKAYGVRDQGQENICAGLAPSQGECKGKYRHECYAVCQQTFATWSRSGADLKKLGDTMCSNGLGGSNCSMPEVTLQDSPNQAFFVSETSFKTSPESGRVDRDWMKKQAAQLDPAKVRYVVAPAALMQPPWNAKLGDVGVAFNAATRRKISFIVGDGGGLGEGSESLLSALRPDAPPRLTQEQSALGEQVLRYRSGVSGNFRFVIFPGTASTVEDYGKVSKQSASRLNNWIDAKANAAFQRSSVSEVMKCSGLAAPIEK